jgi:hypothetical protein
MKAPGLFRATEIAKEFSIGQATSIACWKLAN